MEHDAWFFIGVFVFIFLIWVATGGPMNPLSFSGPTLALPDRLGGGTYLSLPRAPFNAENPTSSSGSDTPGGTTTKPPPSLQGVAFGTPSSYRGKVYMTHSVADAGDSNPNAEYLRISLSSNAPSAVTISGWTLKSEATGNYAVIPGGADVLVSGIVNPAAPITLQPGERAIVASGRSPLGISFRENKCIGYFSTFQTFSPSLPAACPLPSTELKSYYGASYIRDADCIEYVDEIPRCKVVTRAPSGMTDSCKIFITNYLHYNGCLAVHQHDTDFRGETWRIYLGRNSSLWRSDHEVIKLLDSEGKTVDAFTY